MWGFEKAKAHYVGELLWVECTTDSVDRQRAEDPQVVGVFPKEQEVLRSCL